jgi:hypothetical protein
MSGWNAIGATRTHEQGVATRHRTCISKLRKAKLGASDATAQFDPHVSWLELRSNAVCSADEYISKTDNISGILNARQCVRHNKNEDPSQNQFSQMQYKPVTYRPFTASFIHSSENKGSHTRRASQNHSHLVHKSTRSSTSVRQERRVRAGGRRSGLV